jgi:predicted transposase YbfD/YdcC
LRAEYADEDGPVLVQIDGKTARGSYTNGEKSDALHIVSAWASQHGLTLGQVAVDSKSNEITAIPQLLDMMDLKGAIVTVDAMGCQKSIAKKIVEEKGDYTFAVKDNHPKLCEAIEAAYENGFADYRIRSKTTRKKQAGRVEERYYAVGPIPEELKSLTDEWPGAKSIGQAITISTKAGEESSEVRYYISSRAAKAGEFADSVRSHWSIESMHWVLDVAFHEDASRIRSGHATENMSFARRFVITLLKQDTTKVSLKQKRKKAGWNTTFLEKLLFGFTF